MFVLLLLPVVLSADPIDQVAKHGSEIISQSRIAGETIRQCSCAEQSECSEEMRAQAKECAGPCFVEFGAITDRPNDLKKCFDDKDSILQGFLTCFERKLDGCVEQNNGPQIPKTDIRALFSISEHRLVNQSVAIQSLIAPIKHVLKAAGEFAKCIKNCFLAKNANGFCFDRKEKIPNVATKTTSRGWRIVQRRLGSIGSEDEDVKMLME
ncbi:hypothetical protein KIN20_000969 [Parelaphostrongylus tenuis]|uniref:Uncharacterized protein n=1 Tax=Parelaphostrongylus tenuis TaxID=148309 RepID=A0AAD5MBX9_PARTN|nr:hypothetical protein KIN20_000969 [Parelaphostrongylus tenuis]